MGEWNTYVKVDMYICDVLLNNNWTWEKYSLATCGRPSTTLSAFSQPSWRSLPESGLTRMATRTGIIPGAMMRSAQVSSPVVAPESRYLSATVLIFSKFFSIYFFLPTVFKRRQRARHFLKRAAVVGDGNKKKQVSDRVKFLCNDRHVTSFFGKIVILLQFPPFKG